MNKKSRMTYKQTYQQVQDLSGKRYFSVSYEVSSYYQRYSSDGSETNKRVLEQRCGVYVDDEGWFYGTTWEMAIDLLKEKMGDSIKEEDIHNIIQI